MKKLLLALLFCGSVGFVQAQEQGALNPRWYVGVDGGVSFGYSSLRSIGMDKTRTGFGVGVLGGYHINSFLSVEAELSYRHLGLGAYDCCQHLFLGADGNRYFAPVAGMNSWQYRDLRSSVSLYGLGARLNVDFVRMFKPQSRWSFLVSPAIYGMGSSASVKIISTDKEVRNGSSFHFGIGGDLGVGYQVSPRTNIRLYSGMTYLTGNGIDAMPQAEHKSSYIWNSGVKVTFAIGKRKAKQTASHPAYVAPAPVVEAVKEEPKAEVKKEEVAQTATPVQPTPQPQKEETMESVTKHTIQEEVIKTPLAPLYEVTILFARNSCEYIEHQEYVKTVALLKALKAHPKSTIEIDGWCDNMGDDEINNKVSYKRARTIKRYITRNGVAESRITIKGNGVDTTAESDAKARRAEIKLYVTEK